jgi:hypothetical protein
MKTDPWAYASFTMEIGFDIAILSAAVLVGWFGVSIQAPVLVFVAAVFIATSICWLIADIWRASRLAVMGWIIPAVLPEVGMTFSWSFKSISVCVYLVRVNLIATVYRRKK